MTVKLSVTEGEGEGEGVQLRTLERGLQILSLFDAQHPEWTFADICKHTGLSKATTSRFCRKLVTLDYLAYDENKRTYHLGLSLLRVAYLASSTSEITRIAHPHLVRLVAEVGEAVNFALPGNQGPTIVDEVYAPNAFQPHLLVGHTLHGLTTAHSRVVYAYASETERLKALITPQERRTEHTITDPQALADMLAEVKRSGVAFSQEEWFVGACAVAAPVFDGSQQVIGTIAIVAPPERFDPDRRAVYAQAVKATANALTTDLGGLTPAHDDA